MEDKDNLGDKIKYTVEDALNTIDFKGLNKGIENVVVGALNEVKKSMDKFSQKTSDKKKAIEHRGPIAPVGKVSGVLFTVFGAVGVGLFSILVVVFFSVGYVTQLQNIFGSIGLIFILLLLVSIGLLLNGNSIRQRRKRSTRYLSRMDGKGFSSINNLARSIGRSEKDTLKDLKSMIRVGIFPEGHLDNEEGYFMLNDIIYGEYLQLEEGKKIKKIEEKKRQEDSKSRENIDPEVRKAIEKGRDFVKVIREANIEIPGEEISSKLDRLESVTNKIFDYVELHPEKSSEIKKFSEYFLPTSLKLVEAYRKLDSQPSEGENILKAKKEIEDTLDTINHAFENLLDSLFEDMAMDISTDISVLETMLAQEGLANRDMNINKN